jgi:glycosyltransferase involved in cell wall biosynthesis
LTIVGDGPYKEEMSEILSGYNVNFTGYLYNSDLIKQYQSADLFVFPSCTDTMGNVILEAHACGLPTLVTNQGGPKENIIEGVNGFILYDINALNLADKIKFIFDNKDLSSMSVACRNSVLDKDFDKVFLNFIKNYEI